jgi:hypothetical protein
MNRATIVVALLTACASEAPPELETANLDGLEYAVPAGWKSNNQSEHQTKIIVWTPSGGDNTRHESIALMRTRELPALVKSDVANIQRFLTDAQRSLPHAKGGKALRFKTKHGLVGARVESDFIPDGTKSEYRRFHAVVIDGASLVHVLYTAADANRETFNLVLDSLTRKAS